MSRDEALRIGEGREFQSGGCDTEGSVSKRLQPGVGGGKEAQARGTQLLQLGKQVELVSKVLGGKAN